MATTPDIARTWQRITAWCSAHAPHRLEDLQGPASAKHLKALRECGLPLPEALFESLAVHDGETGETEHTLLPGGGTLLGAKTLLKRWKERRKIFADLDDSEDDAVANGSTIIGAVRPVSNREAWLPIADLNGDVVWMLDFDPAPGGTPGQVIRVDLEGCEWIVCADSYGEFLAHFADALEQGKVPAQDPEDEDGPRTLWPPLDQLPAFTNQAIDLPRLRELARTGQPDLALQLAARLPEPLPPEDRLRFSAYAGQGRGDFAAALRDLDALRASGVPEEEADVALRLTLMEFDENRPPYLAELEAAVQRFGSADMLQRRARFHHDHANETPHKSKPGEAMKWLASPPGQQHSAVCRERAVKDYRAALALAPDPLLHLQLAECLLDSQRWEEAEAEYTAILEALEDDDSDEAESQREQAEEGLERARNQDEEGESEEALEGMDELLKAFGAPDGIPGEAPADLREARDALAEILGTAKAERAQRDENPELITAQAQSIAAQVAAQHADTPERLVPFDPPLDDKAAMRFYDFARKTIEKLGYTLLADAEPVRNTENTGMRVLLRLMVSSDQRVVAMIWRLKNGFQVMQAIELESWLDDGRVIITNNTGAANPFDPPPGIDQQSLPIEADLPMLDQEHRRRLQIAGATPRRFSDLASVTALLEHQRVAKRRAAQAKGWISEAELRGLLGGSYRELGPQVRACLRELLE